MNRSINDYRKIIGDEAVDKIYENASPLFNKHIVHVNSTMYGGGVAEILGRLVPLFNDAGLRCGWRVFKGSSDFFSITKKVHNNLQGDNQEVTSDEWDLYLAENEYNSSFTHLNEHDAVIIHDPQPLPMIKFVQKKNPWIWRCHIDLSKPDPATINHLKQFMTRYDSLIFHRESFRANTSLPERFMPPSIDPISIKNKDITDAEIEKVFKKHDIQTDKPLIVQISRFDKWKDPLGVIEVFKKIKQEVDARLVMAGSFAIDDSEGELMYKKIMEQVKDVADVKIISAEDSLLINALQRRAAVVFQKSIKEGFGLTVAEALYKKTPVIASNVGGISLQIQDGISGYLVEPNDIDDAAKKAIHIIKNPDLAKQMGEAGHAYVKQNFLITTHLNNWINILKETIPKTEQKQ